MALGGEAHEDLRETALLQGLVADVLHRDGAQGNLGGRLPHGDVAADRGDERVPGPDGDREVERGDHADDAQRVPLLVHAVHGALGVHGQAVEHARLADREVADVDHLLHFAVAFGLDLAHFHRDQAAQRVLVLAQRLGAQANGFAALRRRYRAPLVKNFLCFLHQVFVIVGRGAVDAADQFAGGRVV